MRVFENRASTVLFRFLKSNPVEYPFLLPANVCPVVPLTFLKARVPFEFIDIDVTHAMDQAACIDRLCQGGYGGVLFVHAYGREFDIVEFYKEIKRITSNIYIIDDRCMCVPRLSENLSSVADLELYSTGYAKYVELGYGGWGILQNELGYFPSSWTYQEEVLRQHMIYIKDCLAQNKRYEWEDVAWLDPSGIEDENVYVEIVSKKMSEISKHKEQINRIYRESLPLEIQWGKDYEQWRFMLSIDEREHILKAIFDEGLFAGTNFPSVAGLFQGVHLLRAEHEAKCLVNLFNDFRVDEEFAWKICKIINSLL